MLKLEIEYCYDFFLLGLSCHEPAYRLCWAINNKLGLQLEKLDQDVCILSKDIESYHQYFLYESVEDNVIFSLVKNRGELGGLLMPNFPKMDYFLKIENYSQEEDMFLDQVRKLPWVNAVFNIQVNELKYKENLIFE